MITILTSDAYRGFSAPINAIAEHAKPGAQPIFVGRVIWPGSEEPEDVVIKVYEPLTCGVANEVIGYTANALRGISQPKRGGILLLPASLLPPLGVDLTSLLDPESGLAVCWITSLEQHARPFRYVRRLSTFTEKQLQAFYKSRFCLSLTGVDHVTGNNDRHDGNFLYLDDLQYLAIDQGSVGGSVTWHTIWPDETARNELLALVQENLSASQLAVWHSNALIEFYKTETIWNNVSEKLSELLRGLLTQDQIDTITSYMDRRVHGTRFQASCSALI